MITVVVLILLVNYWSLLLFCLGNFFSPFPDYLGPPLFLLVWSMFCGLVNVAVEVVAIIAVIVVAVAAAADGNAMFLVVF